MTTAMLIVMLIVTTLIAIIVIILFRPFRPDPTLMTIHVLEPMPWRAGHSVMIGDAAFQIVKVLDSRTVQVRRLP